MRTTTQLLSSLAVKSLDEEDFPIGPSVHTHSRLRFRRPATGVSGHESSLSDSEEEESRFSPVRGPHSRGGDSVEENTGELDCSDGDEAEGDGVENGLDEVVDSESVDVEGDGDLDSGLDSTDSTEASEELEDVDMEDESRERVEFLDVSISISEWAKVYLELVISSSSGVRNDTFLVGGKKGRKGAIYCIT